MSDDDFQRLAGQLTPELHRRFQRALECGHWPDGRALSPHQAEICLQAVLLWEARAGISPGQRTGQLADGRPVPCPSTADAGSVERPVQLLED